MFGIIAAMDEELNAILEKMERIEGKTVDTLKFYRGLLNRREVVLVKSGVGKVNAAMATTIMLTRYRVRGVLNVGIAGSLSAHLKICDTVIADKVAQWDMDLTAFDYPRDFTNEKHTYIADARFVERLKQIIHERNAVVVGPMVTGDQFIYHEKQIAEIKSHFPTALCVDMEAGAIAQVCTLLKVPFAVIRSISDITTQEDNQVTFDELLKSSCEIAAASCYKAVAELED